jgi:SAM-dependent methyltransferase
MPCGFGTYLQLCAPVMWSNMLRILRQLYDNLLVLITSASIRLWKQVVSVYTFCGIHTDVCHCCRITGGTVTAADVSAYYSDTLKSSSDLQTSCCTTGTTFMPANLRQAVSNVHPDVIAKHYGCGLVAPELLQGLRVLDLGCGAGRDCYVLSQLVGEYGSVVGVDMSAAQLATATVTEEWHRQRFGYARSNVRFVQRRLETLLEEDGHGGQRKDENLDTRADTAQGTGAAAGEGIKTEPDSDGDEMSGDEDEGLELNTRHDDMVAEVMPSPKPAAALVASQDDDAG